MYRVLLVDDEPAILQAEERAIKNRTKNFKVVGEAYTVGQAIPLIEELKPDVVITDMKMPKKSGIELIRYISNLENNRIICVAVSGYSDFEYVHDAFALGAYEYLLKPVEPRKLSELFERIDKLLEESKQHEEELIMPQPKMSGAELVERIEEYVRKHLLDDNSIYQMCSRFNISQPYLSKIFKKYRSNTYNEYVNSVKIESAKKLIGKREEYLMRDVSRLSGFSDQFYFSKVFKNMVGCTPKEYQKSLIAERKAKKFT